MSAGFQDFTVAVMRELHRARVQHPAEEGALTDVEWLAVLTEEVGECAHAIQDEGDDALRAELAQVAAVAARWYLSVPRGRVRPPWSPSGPAREPPAHDDPAQDGGWVHDAPERHKDMSWSGS